MDTRSRRHHDHHRDRDGVPTAYTKVKRKSSFEASRAHEELGRVHDVQSRAGEPGFARSARRRSLARRRHRRVGHEPRSRGPRWSSRLAPHLVPVVSCSRAGRPRTLPGGPKRPCCTRSCASSGSRDNDSFRGLPQQPSRSLCTLRAADRSEARNTRCRPAGPGLAGRDLHPLGASSWFQGPITCPLLQDQASPGAPHQRIFRRLKRLFT